MLTRRSEMSEDKIEHKNQKSFVARCGTLFQRSIASNSIVPRTIITRDECSAVLLWWRKASDEWMVMVEVLHLPYRLTSKIP
ncbi:hypothetical protein PoB_006869000 [Plakobranchus ocellatus]|uniref:Uncharacterized protein n=1 Tax=Plakobranchus ocellatus TaxID=259542 RepID=A0AAV4DDT9_9GAST|nr:hypothetical protein PoB_006869000 [Plakobranchus ocellatus]